MYDELEKMLEMNQKYVDMNQHAIDLDINPPESFHDFFGSAACGLDQEESKVLLTSKTFKRICVKDCKEDIFALTMEYCSDPPQKTS